MLREEQVFWMGIVGGFFIGMAFLSVILFIFVSTPARVTQKIQLDAIHAGVGEYYLDTNDFSKKFRWVTNRGELSTSKHNN